MSMAKKKEEVSIAELIAAEEELRDLKEQYGIDQKKGRISNIIERLASREEVTVRRKTYLLLILLLGWAGGHHFYTKRYILGTLYLLFCWTGISIAMSIIDIMVALPKPVDEQGMIQI